MTTTQTALGTPSQARTTLGIASNTTTHGGDATLAVGTRSYLHIFTGAGPYTATLPASATLGNQFFLFIRNDTAVDLTIDTATGNINNGPIVTLEPGLVVMVFCDGTDCWTFGVNLNGVPLIGGTMTGPLILSGDPATALQAATKQYVDAIASGIAVQPSCYAATTANLNATYANSAAGVGATLTNAGAMAVFAVDGVSPPINSRILYKNATSTFQNGCYTLTTVGSGAANWVLTRATDYDTPGEIQPGTLFIIQNGTVNMLSSWIETEVVTTVGTDPILFTNFTTSPANYANIALSNLGTTSVNADIVPNAGNTIFLGSTTKPWAAFYGVGALAAQANGSQLGIGAYDSGGAAAYHSFFTVTSNNPPTAVLDTAVTAATQAASNNSTKLATTAYVDTQVTTIAANKALSNLAAVAINTSLLPGANNTIDLGDGTHRMRQIYSSGLTTGTTAANTLILSARDVDGASDTAFITLTANNIPTCVLASAVTATTQAPADNSTKIATTAYADAIAAGSGSITFLGSATPAGAATGAFDNLLSATYDDYILLVDGYRPATNGSQLILQFGTGAGPTYQTANYVSTAWVNGVTSSTTNGICLSLGTIGSFASATSNYVVYIQNVNHAEYTSATGFGYNIYSGGSTTVQVGTFGGQWQQTTTTTSVRLTQVGNITSARLKLYGIKKV